jgi:signal transduction histidine kinase
MVLMGEKLGNVYPQGRLIAIINTVNFRILLSLLLITPIVTIIGIFLSHKIAGPIYRMEKFLGDMAAGNFSSRITLRKGDELVSVADKINVLNESLKTAIATQKSSVEGIVAELVELEKIVKSRPSDILLNNQIDKLKNRIRDFEAHLAKFKT